jgi:flagellar biosynthesis protein FliR
MKNSTKYLSIKQLLITYATVLFILTTIGWNFNIGWYGLKFSLPIIGVALIIDFILTYKKYKKWLKI